MEIVSFDTREPASSISALFYGQAKTGKTDFAGSAGPRALYIDVGKSSETFHGLSYKNRRGPFKGLYVAIKESVSKTNFIIPDKAEAYDQVCDAIDEALDKYDDKFDTVILDELTAFSRFAMNKGMEANLDTGKSKANIVSKKWDLPMPGKQDFGAEMGFVKNFLAGTIDLLKDRKKHFIVLAHEKYLYGSVTNQQTGVRTETDTVEKILPAFTGKKDIDAIPNMFDLVWNFQTARAGDNTIYRIQTNGDGVLVAGTRYGGIFNRLESGADLDWNQVVSKIREGTASNKAK